MKCSTKPKRILYLENGQGYGGAVICMELLLQALDRNRYEPFVSTSYMDAGYQNFKTIAPFIYLPHRFFNKNQLMDRLSIRESGVPKTGILLKGCQQLLSLADYAVNIFPYVLRLIALCRRKQIDLVHLNNEPVCNMGGLIAAKMLGWRGQIGNAAKKVAWERYAIENHARCIERVYDQVSLKLV